MSLKFIALGMASVASAQLTTTAWFPDVFDQKAFTASVASLEGDKTVISIDWKSAEDAPILPATLTVGPSYLGYTMSQAQPNGVTMLIDNKCSRKDKNAAPVCVITSSGDFNKECEQLKSFTGDQVTTATRTMDGSTVVVTATIPSIDAELPDYCSGGASAEATQVTTLTLAGDDEFVTFTDVQLVITAGADKLSAAATPTGGAQSTGGAQPTGSAQASDAKSSGPTGSQGAAPMMTAAPMLAGLGAAAAAIFL